MFTYTAEYHEVNTRSSTRSDPIILKLNLTLAQKNTRYYVAKLWKQILKEIKSAPNLESFKQQVYAFSFP